MSTAGRGQQEKTVNAGLNNINTGSGIQTQAGNLANSELNTSGGLSPLVSKQLANEQGMIGKAYQGASQAANRGLSQRGMGVAPSGLQASITNTGINNQGQAETGAVGNAFGTQNNLNQVALNPAIAAEQAQAGNIGASTGANKALNSMPSTGQQVFSGLQGLANTGTGMMMGGGSLLSGLSKFGAGGGGGGGGY
jgi:hypothetical protein